jgi:hypothetical protein
MIRKVLYVFLWVISSSLGLYAQTELVGKVMDSDSAMNPVFQADVNVYQGDKLLQQVKTYFDGTFRIKVKASQSYKLKVSYSGYVDSITTIAVDKKGFLKSGSIQFNLQKDGMRLVGYVLDKVNDLPLADVTLLLKNVMTRREDKYFTDGNGYYNIRLDYETNYSLKIDKRSPSIFNKFQDTAIFISTIGFNSPLDFKLDIKLGPATEKLAIRKDYDPKSAPVNKTVKPIIEVYAKRDSTKIKQQQEAVAALNAKLQSKDSIIASLDRKIAERKQADTILTASIVESSKSTKAQRELKKKQEEELALSIKEQENQVKIDKRMADAKEKETKTKLTREQELALKQQAEQAAIDKETAKLQELEIQARIAMEKSMIDVRKKIAAREEREKQAKLLQEKEQAENAIREKTLKQEQDAQAILKAQQAADQLAQAQATEDSIALVKTQQKELQRLAKEQEAKRAQLAKLDKERTNKVTNAKDSVARAEAIALKAQATLLKQEIELKDKARKEKEIADKANWEKEQREKAIAAERERLARAQADKLLKQRDKEYRDSLATAQYTLKKKLDQREATLRDSINLAAEARTAQLEADLAKMKKARETELTARIKYKQENDRKEKAKRLERDRIAVAEADELKKKKKDTDKYQLRLAETKRKADEAIAIRELEARRAEQEREKTDLQQQLGQAKADQQTIVEPSPDAKPALSPADAEIMETTRKNMMQYYERQVREKAGDKAAIGDTRTLYADGPTRTIKVTGLVKNAQTTQTISGVSVNVRRLNSIVSQEVASVENGEYSFMIDSGYFYLVSFYKDGYDISKQILDLTAYNKDNYSMLTQLLNERDEFDPTARMPVIPFEKNSSILPAGVWGDLQSIVKMMKQVPDLKIKFYGMASVDEDYPMELSVGRARTVANIILEQGIKSTKVRIKGIGAYRPRSGCIEHKPCTQEQYKADRVVLYKVIKD